MKIAAIVPAHNEAPRIADVLSVLTASDTIDEVIVVDDASTDGTGDVAKKYPVQFVRLARNQGKGGAMAAGINVTDADILAFIDADLIGLRADHISRLVRPLLDDESLMMVTSRFAAGRFRTNLSQSIAPILNGQRAVRRELLEHVPDFASSRYGVETIITRYARQNKVKTLEVVLDGLTQVMKEEKHGLARGAKHRAQMYKDVLKHRIAPKKKGK